jgi:hypothetical protein
VTTHPEATLVQAGWTKFQGPMRLSGEVRLRGNDA